MEKSGKNFTIVTINHGRMEFTGLCGWRLQLVEEYYNSSMDDDPIIFAEYMARATTYKFEGNTFDYDEFQLNPYILTSLELKLTENELQEFSKLFIQNDGYLDHEDESVDNDLNNAAQKLYFSWVTHYKQMAAILNIGKLPKYLKPSEINTSPIIPITQAIDKEKSKDEKLYTNVKHDDQCKSCGDKVSFSFYVAHNEETNRSFTYCSVRCLELNKEKFSKYPKGLILYHFRRCSAYFKCLEIGNIRKMCVRKEVLSKNDNSMLLHNFCEPGQAGLILVTHKIHEYMKVFGKSSEKQFKKTLILTIITIFLSILNFAPLISNFFQGTSKKTENYFIENNKILTQLDILLRDLINMNRSK